jgi:ubiquinone/menaquinone biosynthesis C-methylase UbiE
MVHEAHTLARTRGHHNTAFCQADAEALPFRHDVCDLITSKLAFHYFPLNWVGINQSTSFKCVRATLGGSLKPNSTS